MTVQLIFLLDKNVQTNKVYLCSRSHNCNEKVARRRKVGLGMKKMRFLSEARADDALHTFSLIFFLT